MVISNENPKWLCILIKKTLFFVMEIQIEYIVCINYCCDFSDLNFDAQFDTAYNFERNCQHFMVCLVVFFLKK